MDQRWQGGKYLTTPSITTFLKVDPEVLLTYQRLLWNVPVAKEIPSPTQLLGKEKEKASMRHLWDLAIQSHLQGVLAKLLPGRKPESGIQPRAHSDHLLWLVEWSEVSQGKWQKACMWWPQRSLRKTRETTFLREPLGSPLIAEDLYRHLGFLFQQQQ